MNSVEAVLNVEPSDSIAMFTVPAFMAGVLQYNNVSLCQVVVTTDVPNLHDKLVEDLRK